jgi:hypothetical protein
LSIAGKKNVDRETELLLERRRAYRDYLLAASDLKCSIGWGIDRNPHELISRYYAIQDQLILIAEEKIVAAVLDHRDAFSPLIKEWRGQGFKGLADEHQYDEISSGEAKAYFNLLFALRDDSFDMAKFTMKSRVGDADLTKPYREK